MITVIFGLPGTGKTSLMTAFLKKIYFSEGRKILKNANAEIERINEKRTFKLPLLERPPIFTDMQYDVRLHVGYKKFFEPYKVNPYHLALPNERLQVQYIPPYSRIFIQEAQKYYDSRQSGTFPPFVSRFFEQHRHYKIDIYLDVQRPMLIDKNIREICKRFILVQSCTNELDESGNVIETTFHCMEFSDWTSAEDYLSSGAASGKQTTYVHLGNIFKCYNSFSNASEYVPPEGRGFDLLEPINNSEINKLKPEMAAFYNTIEPKAFRSDVKRKEENEQKKKKQ